MSQITIDRLELRCRGIRTDTAQAALHELEPALLRHLAPGAAPAAAPEASPTIHLSAHATPATLASVIAHRVAGTIQNQSSGSKATHRR